MIRKKQM